MLSCVPFVNPLTSDYRPSCAPASGLVPPTYGIGATTDHLSLFINPPTWESGGARQDTDRQAAGLTIERCNKALIHA